jgi:hypothetical protein
MRINSIGRGAIFGSWDVISVPIDDRLLVLIATSHLRLMLTRLVAIARRLFATRPSVVRDRLTSASPGDLRCDTFNRLLQVLQQTIDAGHPRVVVMITTRGHRGIPC